MSGYAHSHVSFRQYFPTTVIEDLIVEGYKARGGVIPDDAKVKVIYSVSERDEGALMMSLLIRTPVDGGRVVPVDVKRLASDLKQAPRRVTLERYKGGN